MQKRQMAFELDTGDKRSAGKVLAYAEGQREGVAWWWSSISRRSFGGSLRSVGWGGV